MTGPASPLFWKFQRSVSKISASLLCVSLYLYPETRRQEDAVWTQGQRSSTNTCSAFILGKDPQRLDFFYKVATKRRKFHFLNSPAISKEIGRNFIYSVLLKSPKFTLKQKDYRHCKSCWLKNFQVPANGTTKNKIKLKWSLREQEIFLRGLREI